MTSTTFLRRSDPQTSLAAFGSRLAGASSLSASSIAFVASSCARGLLAPLLLCLSFGALAQNYYTAPGSPIRTFGQRYAQAAQVVDSQSRMVFYRTRQSSSVPGAASIYVNGAYHASIIPGGYSELCMPPGSIELGLKSVEVGRNVKDNLDTITVMRSASAQTQFFRVQDTGRGRQVLQPVQAAEALREIDGAREQTHTISRVTGAVECSINRNPAPAPQTITLAADALFAFGRSDLGAMSPTGRASLDALVARLRSEYIQLDRMHIIGHADPLGQPGPNERLSMDRANTVQQYLAQAGLGSVRMSSEGRGDREPVATQCGRVATPQAIACHAPNRRVVIDIAGARR
ncbi:MULTISPECIES: OmpA family protein [unclassified Limnohabitans]|uniref:OmpA family protein n=1 Tax=unclassified Limnohabitans TaxID=2626134 RepID=UPI001304E05F|nr:MULTISPECIES: OmpA family protein [unclassified Limnohabitans]